MRSEILVSECFQKPQNYTLEPYFLPSPRLLLLPILLRFLLAKTSFEKNSVIAAIARLLIASYRYRLRHFYIVLEETPRVYRQCC